MSFFDIEWSPERDFEQTLAKHGDAWLDNLTYKNKSLPTMDAVRDFAVKHAELALHGHFVVRECADELDEYGERVWLASGVVEVAPDGSIYEYMEAEE